MLPPPALHLVVVLDAGRGPHGGLHRRGASVRRAQHPTAHARHLAALRTGADRFAEAFATGDRAGVIRAADAYGQALAALGAAPGLPIVTPALQAGGRSWPASLGGAAKPSGAGGGDVGRGVFRRKSAAAETFARAMLRARFWC